MPADYGAIGNIPEEEGLLAGRFPMLSWVKDEYADWLLTNSTSLSNSAYSNMAVSILASKGLEYATGVGKIIAGYKLLDSLFNINQALITDYEHSLVPPSSKGLSNGGDINTSSLTNTFYFYNYSIKYEFAEIIDHYFDMYGYKVNSLEVPNLHTRVNWNFLKIIDPNIEGAVVPEKDMNKFKEQLKEGITFWHDPTTFRDYSQSNGNS